MTKRRSKRYRKNGTSSQGTENPVLLPGLGGEPFGSVAERAPGPPSRYDMERMHRAMGKLLAEKDFEDVDEMNAYLDSCFAGRKIDDIVGEMEPDPIAEAQDLAYGAMEAETLEEAFALSSEALKLDPNCVDALMFVATAAADTVKERIEGVRVVLARAEENFGSEYMAETAGHFWGVVETRPYMRARQALIALLEDDGQLEEAIRECERSLELNPNDNQGLRDVLRGLYLRVGNLEGVRRLAEDYDDSMFAASAWSMVLERFLSGELTEAQKLVRRAHKDNPHVAGYLTGRKRLPKDSPECYSPGDANEAVCCCELIGEAWCSHPKAMKWLKSLKGLG